MSGPQDLSVNEGVKKNLPGSNPGRPAKSSALPLELASPLGMNMYLNVIYDPWILIFCTFLN